jgi:trehalose 6-phosphate phosphatase
MKHLLSRENREVLAQLAWSRVLVAFDFDGTLAPIVANRHEAQMQTGTRKLFAAMCGLYPCAVISGRSQADVSTRLDPAPVKYVIGNHGLEPGASLEEFEGEITRARSLLEGSLIGIPGLDLEDKRYSLALHYRRSRNKRSTRAAILEAVAALQVPMRVIPGKLVVNVVPARAPNKGDAVVALRNTEAADTALYVGDDVTDEDVFELDQPGRLLTVRVGESRTSAAAYFLRDQREVDRLLANLVSLRQRGAST